MNKRMLLIAGAAAAIMLVAGCGAKPAAGPEEASAVPAAGAVEAAGADAASPAPAEVQSRRERQLVMLFQGLLRVDGQEGLALTSAQAEALLPIVRKSKDEGSLGEEAQQQMLELLTAEQRAAYDKLSEAAGARMREGGALKRREPTPEERERMVADFQRRRNADRAAPGRAEADAAPRPADTGNKGFGKNVEQQLIDLLESRLKQ